MYTVVLSKQTKKMIGYEGRSFMKTEVKEKLIMALEQGNIKQIMESEDFYFQKAVDKYNEMMQLPKLSEDVTERLVKRVEELRNTNSFSHQSLLKEFDDKSPEYELLFKIGELVAYIDSGAGVIQVYTDLFGENCVVNVNVKTGWYHG
jgi:hypothetical protein